MLETRYLLALGVLIFWIIVRIFLMQRRKTLINRWREREEIETAQTEEAKELQAKIEPPQ